MIQGFWKTLPKNFIGLAPMDGVTDSLYRNLFIQHKKPDFMVTEFVSAEGLAHNAIKILNDLEYEEVERPLVAQLFGIDPESFYTATVILCELGFDGVDINMGCPAKKVERRGAGAGLIQNPQLASTIIKQSLKAIEDCQDGKISLNTLPLKNKMKDAIQRIKEKHTQKPDRPIPLSLKTRIGYDSICTEDWITHLIQFPVSAITIHGRTLKQMYSGQANWQEIQKGTSLIQSKEILAIGNGDISSITEAKEKCEHSGVDGVMIGRATFGNPWIFSGTEPDIPERIQMAITHCLLYEKKFPEKPFYPMRKYLAWYIKGIEHAKETRSKLMLANSSREVEKILKYI